MANEDTHIDNDTYTRERAAGYAAADLTGDLMREYYRGAQQDPRFLRQPYAPISPREIAWWEMRETWLGLGALVVGVCVLIVVMWLGGGW